MLCCVCVYWTAITIWSIQLAFIVVCAHSKIEMGLQCISLCLSCILFHALLYLGWRTNEWHRNMSKDFLLLPDECISQSINSASFFVVSIHCTQRFLVTGYTKISDKSITGDALHCIRDGLSLLLLTVCVRELPAIFSAPHNSFELHLVSW